MSVHVLDTSSDPLTTVERIVHYDDGVSVTRSVELLNVTVLTYLYRDTHSRTIFSIQLLTHNTVILFTTMLNE